MRPSTPYSSARDKRKKKCVCDECGPEGQFFMPQQYSEHARQQRFGVIPDSTAFEIVESASFMCALSPDTPSAHAAHDPSSPSFSRSSLPSNLPTGNRDTPSAEANRLLGELKHLEGYVDTYAAKISDDTPLVFSSPPSSSSTPYNFADAPVESTHPLKPDAPANRGFLASYYAMLDVKETLNHPSYERSDGDCLLRRDLIVQKIALLLHRLETLKGAEWERQRGELGRARARALNGIQCVNTCEICIHLACQFLGSLLFNFGRVILRAWSTI